MGPIYLLKYMSLYINMIISYQNRPTDLVFILGLTSKLEIYKNN